MATPEQRGTLASLTASWIAPPGSLAWLVVAHGAGAGMGHPFLAGFCRKMAEERVATVRFDFPYMAAGRRSPDPEATLRAAWTEAFEGASSMAGELPMLAGGKSLGGRIASMCVADGMPAAGLVFLGYPLHPPGKPDRLRAEHLERIRVPMLFLQGTKDPFARPEVLGPVLERLGRLVAFEPVEGGDHSFRVRGGTRDDREIGAGLAGRAGAFVRDVVGAR